MEQTSKMIKALIALGNMGEEYKKTYHNVGVFVSAVIARLVAEEGAGQIQLYEPVGFMNESGAVAKSWLKYHNLSLDDAVVVHDDSDLPVGSYKLVKGGGSAGHKGIESLVSHFGTEGFLRLRVGIRNPNEAVRAKSGDFVLKQWNAQDEQQFVAVAQRAWKEIQII